MLSGEDIQANLRGLAARWAAYRGTERGEAQTFLNELVACYGRDRFAVGAIFEDSQNSGIVDMLWPDRCIIEMKAPHEAARLATHRAQALRYWHSSDDAATNRPAVPYIVLCAFHQFEVWEPGRFPRAPRDTFTLDQLGDRYESLLFLSGPEEEPQFHAARRELTTEAAKRVVELHTHLADRKAAPPEVLRSFTLQMVWCLFAESLGLLPGHPVERIIAGLKTDSSRSSAAELGHLFAVLNEHERTQKGGLYAGAPYANGGLFAQASRVHLHSDELALLSAAAAFEWRKVDPTIFGALMEGCLGRGRRWELGAHYTHEVDILKIVRPTIVFPWRERIAAAATTAEAERALADLCRFTVLDPACGCGNFLYVAYRELRELEHEAKEKITALATAAGEAAAARPLPSYPIGNVRGIELDEFAVLISRVTLWMGHKLAADTYGMAESVLPLVDLSGVRQGDALAVPWPQADVIIGNPPFQGSQHLRKALGDAYVAWLSKTFNCGVKDLCVYWFRRAQDHLAADGRAGLVGTNSISQNRARSASLDYVIANGGVITNAISTQDWPGEAAVDVSIVNWIKTPSTTPTSCVLDGEMVAGITSSLRADTGAADPRPLVQNTGRCFQGPSPVGEGFVLLEHDAQQLFRRTDAHYADVVRRYLISNDIAEDPRQEPTRWIIDFGLRPLQEAMRYPAALDILREKVKPERANNALAARRDNWWLFGVKAVGMRKALHGLDRYIAGGRVGKRLFVCWCEPAWCPSDATNVFVFADSFSFGVLSSIIHDRWAWERSSTLEDRLRYTPSSVFETFPWPEPSPTYRQAIADAADAMVELRRALCLQNNIGLTALYNRVEEGAYKPLQQLHATLDAAVAAAYGWPKSVLADPAAVVRKLLELNLAIATGVQSYDPFTIGKAATAPLTF